MKCKYAVTFEFEARQPITTRGEMEASAVNTIASRAVREAKKSSKPINWSSMSLILERIDNDNSEEVSESELPESDNREQEEEVL